MKKAIRILAIACVLSLLCCAFALTSVADDVEYTGDIATATGYISTVTDTAATVQARAEAMWQLDQYLKSNPIDPQSAGYADYKVALTSAALLGSEATLETYDASEPNYVCKTVLNKINRYTKMYPEMKELADYAEFEAALNAKRAEYDAMEQADKDELEKAAGAEEYDITSAEIYIDMDTTKTLSPTQVARGTYAGVRADEYNGGNEYYVVDYSKAEESMYTYCNERLPDTTNGMVFEFDFTYFNELVTDFGIVSGEDSLITTGARCFPEFFSISKGVISATGDTKGKDLITGKVVQVDGVLVPGEWTHIMIVYEPVEKTATLYIDYEYVTIYSVRATANSTGKIEDYNLTGFRMGCQLLAGEWCVDNVHYYQGTAYRDDERFEAQTDEEKFEYYADFLTNESIGTRKVTSIDYAVTKAEELLPNYYDAATQTYKGGAETEGSSIRAAVDKYLSFNREDAILAIGNTNALTFKKYVDEALAVVRTVSNLTERRTHYAKISAFIETNNFNTQSEDYKTAFSLYEDFVAGIEYDTEAEIFVETMKRFERATTYEAKLVHYNDATASLNAMRELGTQYAISDPTIDNYRNLYDNAVEEIEKYRLITNSRILIACADIIGAYATEREWAEHYDYILGYINNMRTIISSGDYDMSYGDTAVAITVYNDMYPYFFKTAQNTHIEIMSDYIEQYRLSSSYIDKVGILSAIEKYVSQNDLDENNPELSQMLVIYNNYVQEVASQRGDYEESIALNTALFVNTVKLLTFASDYSEMVRLVNEATEYSLLMSIGTQEVQEASAIYEQYRQRITMIQTSSKLFVDYAARFNAEGLTLADKYEILADCCELVGSIELSVEGVSAAKDTYDAEYAEYCAMLEPINEELSQTTESVYSLRAGCGVGRLLTFIANLLAE